MNSSDLAYERQNMLLDFMDNKCCSDNTPKNAEEVKSAISELNEAINDWKSIIDYNDSPEITQMNRAGLQRCKTEKKYMKILLSLMEKQNEREVAYS